MKLTNKTYLNISNNQFFQIRNKNFIKKTNNYKIHFPKMTTAQTIQNYQGMI